MSPARLAKIRDRYTRGVCSERDIADLLAEVERLTGVVEAFEVSAHERWADELDAENWGCR